MTEKFSLLGSLLRMLRTIQPGRAAIVGAAVILAASATIARGVGPTATPGPHTLTGSRLTLVFADPGSGFTDSTGDRLDSLVWIDSNGNPTGNLAKHGGSLVCGDPTEFFGQSYGEPEGTHPNIIYAGTTSTWTTKGASSGKSKTAGATCVGPTDAPATTKYTVYSSAGKEDMVLIKRKFMFNSQTPLFNGHGLRPYVPRIENTIYHTVIWPNAASTMLLSADTGNCGGDCEVTDWNQRWFADDSAGGSGSGMLVIRSSKSTQPALLTINNDSFSSSNLSSVVLIQPNGGWKAPVTETEALCFYDTTTWPLADRTAMKLPASCKTP